MIETDKYQKVHIEKNEQFDFDFYLYLPKSIHEEELERNLLVTFKDVEEREQFMAENLQVPMLSIDARLEKEKTQWMQLSPDTLIDENGNQRAFPYGNSGFNMAEQYANAIRYAYQYLKNNKLISENQPEKADVEGYSYNGVIAQRFALLHPELVRSLMVGGAISSIPLPLTEYNGETLNYPAGVADIEKYTGKTVEEIISEYKDIVQAIYATEQELRYDGNFLVDGTEIKRNSDGSRKNDGDLTTTFSQHDLSPDIVEVAVQQMRIFGEKDRPQTDINKRIEDAKKILLENGVNLRAIKIYSEMNHRSRNIKSLEDMKEWIGSLDRIQHENGINSIEKGKKRDLAQRQLLRDTKNISGFEPELRNGKEIKIDLSYQQKREEIYERARAGEKFETILQSMNLEELQRFFFSGADNEPPFMKDISNELVQKIVNQKQKADLVTTDDMKASYLTTSAEQRNDFIKGMARDKNLDKTKESENVK